MRTYSFERLEVWQLAKALTVRIYKVAKKFPEEERYELTRQVRKSVSSVPSNIAEGTGRFTGKDQAHFSTMAYGSLVETLNHLLIAVDLEYLTRDEVDAMRPAIHEVATKLSRLRRAQLNRGAKGRSNTAQEPEAPYGIHDEDDLPPLF